MGPIRMRPRGWLVFFLALACAAGGGGDASAQNDDVERTSSALDASPPLQQRPNLIPPEEDPLLEGEAERGRERAEADHLGGG